MAKKTSTIAIAQRLQELDLFGFDSRMLSNLLNLGKVQTSNLLRRMEEENLVARVEAGKYLLLGFSPERVLSNPLFVGCHLAHPAYVSFWSALHYYGFTEQVPGTVFLATTRKKPPLTFRQMRFRFVLVKPAMFWGYHRQSSPELPIVVADEAKAILDSLLFPQYAGGIGEVAKALKNGLASLDIPTLVEYANHLSSPSMCSRLGFLLDMLGATFDDLIIAKGPVNLDPQRPRAGIYNSHWRVYVNVPLEELFPERVA